MPVTQPAPTPSRRLTVLQILPALESGGTERGVLEIAEALVNAGHRSLVISAGGRLVAELHDRGSAHFERRLGVKSPFTLRHVFWVRRFLIEQHVDVVDIHSRMPGWITLAAWKSLPASKRPALISTVHGLNSVNLYSSIMCRGEHVIAVSNAVQDFIRTNYPFVPLNCLQVIHRGIDSDAFPRGFEANAVWNSEFFKHFPQAQNKKLLAIIGRLSRTKGHENFLKVLAQLRKLNHNVHGLIVGDLNHRTAAYVEELRTLAASLGLQHDVTFTGHRSDVREIYSISSVVFSLSAKPESFGRTVAEALAIGTPVVGYDHGGVAEILAAQFPEGAVTVGDEIALTEKVRSILSSSIAPVPKPNSFIRSRMLQETIELYEKAAKPEQ
jgi:glycosyltransferase involved in cell wall biosynthesis